MSTSSEWSESEDSSENEEEEREGKDGVSRRKEEGQAQRTRCGTKTRKNNRSSTETKMREGKKAAEIWGK